MNAAQISKVYAVHNSQHGEIWWFYPSGTSTEKMTDMWHLDYKEGHWTTGELDRTAGVDQGVFSNPIWADASGNLYNQEKQVIHMASTKPITLKSGSIKSW